MRKTIDGNRIAPEGTDPRSEACCRREQEHLSKHVRSPHRRGPIEAEGNRPAPAGYETVKLNKVDPQVWLSDILSRIAQHKTNCIDELLPRHYHQQAKT